MHSSYRLQCIAQQWWEHMPTAVFLYKTAAGVCWYWTNSEINVGRSWHVFVFDEAVANQDGFLFIFGAEKVERR